MKRIALIVLLILSLTISSNRVSAQEYQPFPTKCAKWEVYRCFYFYQPGWHDKYTLTLDGSDTIYNGDTYKKINIIQHHLPGTIYDSLHASIFFGGMREVNKKIYIFQIWASVDTMPQLVYDFTKTNVGDTIYTKALAGSKTLYGHLVTSVDSVLVGKKYHKRLHLQEPKNTFNTEYWIEGIGSSMGLPWATFWSITDNSYDLSCFNTTHKVVYENPNPTFGMCAGTLPVISCDSSSDCDTVNNCHLKMSVIQSANKLESSQDSAKYQWLDCNSMLPLNGDTNQTFTAIKNGSYAVIVEKEGCVDTSQCVELMGLGMENDINSQFKIYPVPSNGKLFVELREVYNVVSTEIMTVQGQLVQSTSFKNSDHIELTLPDLNGVYILRVIAGEDVGVYRLVKE